MYLSLGIIEYEYMSADNGSERDMGGGIAIGLGLGVAIGVTMDELAMGIALGLVFGLAFDSIWAQRTE
ncbi:hypothetical protein SAMN04488556_3129 [Halostagnicola kamekurae]|uniref:Glycine zipper-like domain-containing protein n=2 Tax=Halostagnicola kamekurae TaxID=619731 RepID=A0A1I6THY1_9EURY|nr:hypothetical protein SAMN04488556_3129 [Halostagnicola kamekurae]